MSEIDEKGQHFRSSAYVQSIPRIKLPEEDDF
jgi:hypothetical protein